MAQSVTPTLIVDASSNLPSANDGPYGYATSQSQHYGLRAGTWEPLAYSTNVPTTTSFFQSAGVSSGGNTGGTTGLVGSRIVFVGSNNITLSQSSAAGGSATISIFGGAGAGGLASAGVSNLGNTGGTTGLVSNQIVFVGSNNITLSQSSAAGGNATVSIYGGAGGAGDGYNILAAGTQTANTTGTVKFLDSNGVSFGMSNSSQITATVRTDWLSTQSNQALSGSNGSFTFQTATFGNLNDVSFYSSNGSMVASVSALSSQSAHAISAANGSFDWANQLLLVNSNGVSFSTSQTGLNKFILASHNGLTSQSNQQISLYATGNTTQSTSNTQNASSILFNGAGVASVGVSNGSIIVSVPAGGGGGFSAGVSNLGNSAGSTGTVSQQIAFFGGNQITLSQSSNLGSATVSFVGQPFLQSVGVSTGGNTSNQSGMASQSLVLVGGNNITLSGAYGIGSGMGTVTIVGPSPGGGMVASCWPHDQKQIAGVAPNAGTMGSTGGSTQWTISYRIYPIVIDNTISFSRLDALGSMASAGGTGSCSGQYNFGLYTLAGSSRFDSVSTWAYNYRMSQNSSTAQSYMIFTGTNSNNSTSSNGNAIGSKWVGDRIIPLAIGATSLAPGQYWGVFGYIESRSSAVYTAASQYLGSEANYSKWIAAGYLGTQSSSMAQPWGGNFTSVTNVSTWDNSFMPASIHTSVITHSQGSSNYTNTLAVRFWMT